ncbi:MAG TPA: C40 family peptidase [Gemmatimonadales bacterium]|nr:C40 family peptidase [Gemmatimonadales bacterium]
MTDTATHVIAASAVAPLLADAGVRAEQVTQLVLGETAAILDRQGEWLRVSTAAEAYAGWLHAGYVLQVGRERADEWRAAATAWSMGAQARVERGVVRLPMRARVTTQGAGIELPDGRWGAVFEGSVPAADAVQADARKLRPDAWAWTWFAGTHYQWGGVTPLGVDCSGLVQTTFAARGVPMPRDAYQQAAVGREVTLAEAGPGDLLFFRGDSGDRITHVAFLSDDDQLVHSTLSCGGVVREPWGPGTRAASLRDKLVAARRVETPDA